LGANLRGQDKKRMKDLSEELSEMEDLRENSMFSHVQILRKNIQDELLQIYENREDLSHQRSMDTWLLKDDNKTEYCHRIANGKRRK
jgi:hypothetical protein